MPSRRRALFLFVVATALAGALAGGCRSKGAPPAREDGLVVFAAASLRDVFTSMAADFERRNPGVAITFNFAGTQELRTQLEDGAAADVFASADERHMAELLRGARVSRPVVFARNEPVLVVSREAVSRIESLADLPKATRVVVGTPEVPIGRYTLQILDRAAATLGADFRARVESKIVSRELNVRQVLAKVSLGEAEAGITYRTDALSRGAIEARVRVVSIPAEVNVVADYPIAVVSAAAHPELGRAWVDFVLSPEGQRALVAAGFTPAGEPAP